MPISSSAPRFIVLSDNRNVNGQLATEHGLCIYLETEKHKCLLDTGASDLFLENARVLGVDLTQVDYVFISHGHADHIGGLSAFLAINSTATVVLSPLAVNQSFYSKRTGFRKISIDFDPEKYPNRFVWVEKDLEMEDDIRVVRCEKLMFATPRANATLYKMRQEKLIPDDFDHELIFCFGTNEQLIYTGCAHKGLLNLLQTINGKLKKPISTVVGGFHIPDPPEGLSFETESELTEMAHYLNTHYPGTRFLAGHCTGQKAYERLKRLMGNRLIQFCTGYSDTINNSNK